MPAEKALVPCAPAPALPESHSDQAERDLVLCFLLAGASRPSSSDTPTHSRVPQKYLSTPQYLDSVVVAFVSVLAKLIALGFSQSSFRTDGNRTPISPEDSSSEQA
jgi:hypothetical protein